MASFLLGHSLVRTRVNELLMVAVVAFSSDDLNTVKKKIKFTRLEAVWRQAIVQFKLTMPHKGISGSR